MCRQHTKIIDKRCATSTPSFSYCALSCCALLRRLDVLNVPAAVAFINACRNFDGSYGCAPGHESHAGQVFTCVGALAVAGAVDDVQSDLLSWWCVRWAHQLPTRMVCLFPLHDCLPYRLAERQTSVGGLNGRPEKLPDVCYSWWCLSALAILDRLHWIDQPALTHFILNCQVCVSYRAVLLYRASSQDEDGGGISDRPEDMVDVYHTFFGIAGLSLMGHPGLKDIDPVFALPAEVVKRVMEHDG